MSTIIFQSVPLPEFNNLSTTPEDIPMPEIVSITTVLNEWDRFFENIDKEIEESFTLKPDITVPAEPKIVIKYKHKNTTRFMTQQQQQQQALAVAPEIIKKPHKLVMKSKGQIITVGNKWDTFL